MKKELIYYFCAIVITMLSMASCENDPFLYQTNDSVWLSGDPDQRATSDSLVYSFRLNGKEQQEADLNLIINLTGEASSVDRSFKLEVVENETNVSSNCYEIGTTVLPAGAIKVKVPVKVKRNITDVDLKHENARLTLRAVNSDELQIGITERNKYTLVWCDYLIQPETWNRTIRNYIGPFSQARYQFIIDFTGLTEFEYCEDDNWVMGFQARLIRLLNEYNSNPANANRPEGWPYLNDNGRPLQFGNSLSY